MGIIGELFPGKKLQNEGSGDSNGQPHLDLDLEAGVIRLSGTTTPHPSEDDESDA
ncbi:hypothetical protein AB0G00_16855 [Nocardia salmonicida]|uniref:hypothetical protein n=1 Tax=Nocardia salmonicida TaxID=53431 RepID=UPI00340BF48C